MPRIQPIDAAYATRTVAHTAIGHLHGVSSSELAAAKQGNSIDSNARAAMAFSLAVLDTKGRVSDVTLTEARAAGLDDNEIVELVAHVALNVFTNYLNNLAGTEVDFPLVRLEQAA
jgi:alkylhydroperoxidase family enzyme